MRRAKRSVHKFLWLITLALSVLQANAPKGTYSCDSIEHTATSTLAPANTTFQTPHCRQKVDNTLTVFPLLALDTTCKLPLDRHFFPRLSRTGLVLPTTEWGHHRADGERILSGQRLVSPVWMLMNAFCNITLQFFSSGRLRRWHASPPPLFFFLPHCSNGWNLLSKKTSSQMNCWLIPIIDVPTIFPLKPLKYQLFSHTSAYQ